MFSAWLAVIRALVWRPFWQGGLRSAFVIVGVALGVAITAAINLANHSALATFRDSIDLVAGRTHVQILPTVQTLPDTILTRLGWLRRLGDVNPVIEAICVVPQHHKTLRLIGVDLLHAGLSGSAEQPALRTDRPVLIHAGLAARWHLAVGDTLAAVADDRPVQFVVAGLIPSTGRTSGWDETFAVTDLAVAQDVLHRPGQLDRIDIQLADPDQTDDVVAALQAQLPPNARALTPERRNAQVGRMLRAFQANLAALSYIALLVGAYLIYNTLSVSVVQRRTEIGTLRALGVSGRQVFAAVTLEALMIGVVGSTLGLGLGLILAQGAVAAVSQTVNSLYINTGGAAAVHYDPLTMILSAMIGLLLSLAAAVLPAWEASRTAPAVAMRRGTWATKQQGRTALFAA
ncbi:MAG: ABC transporter permease, partial [Candidatus Sericytochromatia bacterium]|nr:ABC transporter permease [Candidatus Sericytochromatia bacterium]